MSLDSRLQQQWYGDTRPALWLMPLSWLFGCVVALRRWMFRVGVLRSVKLDKPVIVIGNLTVGGTGKTPLVIWLATSLRAQGQQVAVITRGYGGKAATWPQFVTAHSDPQQVGDEAVLIAQQAHVPVYAGPNRVACATQAIAAGATVVISDDGLQHYRLQRDLELVVIDASRGLGNGHLLPAGPLREPRTRLTEADLLLLNQRGHQRGDAATIMQAISVPGVPAISFSVGLTKLRSIHSGEPRPLDSLRGQSVHVVTGIGNPLAFLKSLRDLNVQLDARILRDHARLTASDIEFGDTLPVLMTEKDAVKCARFAGARHWAVGAQVLLDESNQRQLLECINRCLNES